MTRRRTAAIAAAGLVVAALAATLLLAARDRDAAAGWGPPAEAPSGDAGWVDAAVDGSGRTLAVWAEERGGLSAVMASERPAGGGWSAPQVVLAPQRWRVMRPDVAVNARGDAIVVFEYVGRGSSVVLGAHRPAGGRWEEPRTLSRVARGPLDPLPPAVGPGGEAVAAWSAPFVERSGLRAAVQVATRPAGGGWRDPRPTGAFPHPPSGPRVALAPGGRAIVASPGGVVAVPPAGAPARLPRPPWHPRRVGTLAIATDAAGRAVVAWSEARGDGSEVVAASRLGDDGWGAPRLIDVAPSAPSVGSLQAARARDGVVVAWARWTERWTGVAVRAATLAGPELEGPAWTLDAFAIPDHRAGSSRSTPGPPPTRVVLPVDDAPGAAMWDRLTARAPAFAVRLAVAPAGDGGAWGPPDVLPGGPVTGAWPLAVGGGPTSLVAAWSRLLDPAGGPVRMVVSERGR